MYDKVHTVYVCRISPKNNLVINKTEAHRKGMAHNAIGFQVLKAGCLLSYSLTITDSKVVALMFSSSSYEEYYSL